MQASGSAGRQTGVHVGGRIGEQAGRQAGRQTDRQAGRQKRHCWLVMRIDWGRLAGLKAGKVKGGMQEGN
jgi:hypothetical protein